MNNKIKGISLKDANNEFGTNCHSWEELSQKVVMTDEQVKHYIQNEQAVWFIVKHQKFSDDVIDYIISRFREEHTKHYDDGDTCFRISSFNHDFAMFIYYHQITLKFIKKYKDDITKLIEYDGEHTYATSKIFQLLYDNVKF